MSRFASGSGPASSSSWRTTFVNSLGPAAVDLGGLRDGGRLMPAGGPPIALRVATIG